MVNGQEYVNLLEPELRSLASWESGTVYPSPSDPNRLVFHDGYWTAATVAKQTVAEISGVPSAVRALVASVADRARTPREDGAKILVGKGADPDGPLIYFEHAVWHDMTLAEQNDAIGNGRKLVFVSCPGRPPFNETEEVSPLIPKIIDPAADPPPPCHPPQAGGIVMQECPSEEPTIDDAVEPPYPPEIEETIADAEAVESPPLPDNPHGPIVTGGVPDSVVPSKLPLSGEPRSFGIVLIDEAINNCGNDPTRALAKQYLIEARNVYPKA